MRMGSWNVSVLALLQEELQEIATLEYRAQLWMSGHCKRVRVWIAAGMASI